MNKQKFATLLNRKAIVNSIAIFFLFAIILFSACAKKRAEAKLPAPNYASPSSFYTQYQQPVQTFTVDSPGTGPIIGKEGTKLSGDASIFMYPNGQSIIYPFILKLIEVYTIKDMILSNLPSVGGGKILETGGEISIRAYKGSQELVLKPTKKYFMELDTNPSLLTGMSVFYGFQSGSITDWTNNLTSLDASINPDNLSSVTNQPLFYDMTIGRMGWVNCARLYSNASATTTISFTSQGTNTQNIDVFLAFKNIHSMMRVYNLTSQAIPVGTNLTVIGISRDSNQSNSMVYEAQDITVSSGQQVTLNLQPISDAALLSALGAYK
jgi:hypothetical protein